MLDDTGFWGPEPSGIGKWVAQLSGEWRWLPAKYALQWVKQEEQARRKIYEDGRKEDVQNGIKFTDEEFEGAISTIPDVEIIVSLQGEDYYGPNQYCTSAYWEDSEARGGPGWVVYGSEPDPDLPIVAWMPTPPPASIMEEYTTYKQAKEWTDFCNGVWPYSSDAPDVR